MKLGEYERRAEEVIITMNIHGRNQIFINRYFGDLTAVESVKLYDKWWESSCTCKVWFFLKIIILK